VVELLHARGRAVDRALDVGCGTGLSTRPLTAIARTVVGVDASNDMLRLAGHTEGVSYVLGDAEQLPFAGGAFDLVTLCSAIHWFDPSALVQLRDVLAAGGRLVIYDVWFPAEMAGTPAFAGWMRDACGPRYPRVTKNRHESEAMVEAGFRLDRRDDLRYEVPMRLEQLVDYLMMHSERIAAIDEGRETEPQQRGFLSEGLAPFFEGRVRQLVFGIWVETYFTTPHSFEDEHRDLPIRLRLVLRVVGPRVDRALPPDGLLVARDLARRVVAFGRAILKLDVRVLLEVVVPDGMLRGAAE
jgi:SAM-dependent methyltransferase